jgi:excinuclease ABC subunit C
VEDEDSVVKWLSEKSKKSIKITVPQKGDQYKLLEMCQKNARESLLQKLQLKEKHKSPLKDMQVSLGLKSSPDYIEAYDISNIHGSDNVGAMIVFCDGKPLKSAYRKFKIKDVTGQDDYSSMCEMISRRFKEYEIHKNEDSGFGKKPDLILLDGGKGHVSAVKSKLYSLGYKDIPIFGMVKDSNHKTRAITSEGHEITIKSNQNLFALVYSIQEEVHRFAIGYHKTRRKKRISSSLLSVPGIGAKRAKLLIDFLGSVENIRNATLDELESVPKLTKNAARNIYEYFHDKIN